MLNYLYWEQENETSVLSPICVPEEPETKSAVHKGV